MNYSHLTRLQRSLQRPIGRASLLSLVLGATLTQSVGCYDYNYDGQAVDETSTLAQSLEDVCRGSAASRYWGIANDSADLLPKALKALQALPDLEKWNLGPLGEAIGLLINFSKIGRRMACVEDTVDDKLYYLRRQIYADMEALENRINARHTGSLTRLSDDLIKRVDLINSKETFPTSDVRLAIESAREFEAELAMYPGMVDYMLVVAGLKVGLWSEILDRAIGEEDIRYTAQLMEQDIEFSIESIAEARATLEEHLGRFQATIIEGSEYVGEHEPKDSGDLRMTVQPVVHTPGGIDIPVGPVVMTQPNSVFAQPFTKAKERAQQRANDALEGQRAKVRDKEINATFKAFETYLPLLRDEIAVVENAASTIGAAQTGSGDTFSLGGTRVSTVYIEVDDPKAYTIVKGPRISDVISADSAGLFRVDAQVSSLKITNPSGLRYAKVHVLGDKVSTWTSDSCFYDGRHEPCVSQSSESIIWLSGPSETSKVEAVVVWSQQPFKWGDVNVQLRDADPLELQAERSTNHWGRAKFTEWTKGASLVFGGLQGRPVDEIEVFSFYREFAPADAP